MDGDAVYRIRVAARGTPVAADGIAVAHTVSALERGCLSTRPEELLVIDLSAPVPYGQQTLPSRLSAATQSGDETTAVVAEAVRQPGQTLVWTNADGDVGRVHGIAHLTHLVERVGAAEGWEWLRVAGAQRERPFVQICGHPRRGLVVEFSTHNYTAVVAPAGAAEYPRRNVGALGWRYLAHPTELHDLATAVALTYTYASDGSYPVGYYELRDPDSRIVGWAY